MDKRIYDMLQTGNGYDSTLNKLINWTIDKIIPRISEEEAIIFLADNIDNNYIMIFLEFFDQIIFRYSFTIRFLHKGTEYQSSILFKDDEEFTFTKSTHLELTMETVLKLLRKYESTLDTKEEVIFDEPQG